MLTTGDMILRDIICNPLDNSLRLIYADWLDDNDSSRQGLGDFIRAQVRHKKPILHSRQARRWFPNLLWPQNTPLHIIHGKNRSRLVPMGVNQKNKNRNEVIIENGFPSHLIFFGMCACNEYLRAAICQWPIQRVTRQDTLIHKLSNQGVWESDSWVSCVTPYPNSAKAYKTRGEAVKHLSDSFIQTIRKAALPWWEGGTGRVNKIKPNGG